MALDPATRFLIFHKMTEMGIIPIIQPYHDYGKILDSLPPEEARVLRRKFRKEWRKFARGKNVIHKRTLGLGVTNPSRGKKNNRKYYLFYEILRSIYSNR